MGDSFDDFISSISDDPVIARPVKKDRPKYPCGQCHGTGRYHSPRVHQEKEHCFACRGTGYFLKSPEKREKTKARREARKVDHRAGILADIAEFDLRLKESTR